MIPLNSKYKSKKIKDTKKEQNTIIEEKTITEETIEETK